MLEINWNAIRTHVFIPDAWRAGRQPEALAQAVTIGEQIIELINQAIRLIEQACADADQIVPGARLRCQAIADRLCVQSHRIGPVLSRLRAAAQAVKS